MLKAVLQVRRPVVDEHPDPDQIALEAPTELEQVVLNFPALDLNRHADRATVGVELLVDVVALVDAEVVPLSGLKAGTRRSGCQPIGARRRLISCGL